MRFGQCVGDLDASFTTALTARDPSAAAQIKSLPPATPSPEIPRRRLGRLPPPATIKRDVRDGYRGRSSGAPAPLRTNGRHKAQTRNQFFEHHACKQRHQRLGVISPQSRCGWPKLGPFPIRDCTETLNAPLGCRHVAYDGFLYSARTFAQRALCAAAMRSRAAADSWRFASVPEPACEPLCFIYRLRVVRSLFPTPLAQLAPVSVRALNCSRTASRSAIHAPWVH